MAIHRQRSRIISSRLKNLTENRVKQITVNATGNLQRANPVDTGFSRNSWIPKIGRAFRRRLTTPAGAKASQNSGLASIASYTLERGKVFISNNASYIQALNRGRSPQAPAGWVPRALRRAVDEVARRSRGSR